MRDMLPTMYSMDILKTSSDVILICGGVRKNVSYIETSFFEFNIKALSVKQLVANTESLKELISPKFLFMKHHVFPIGKNKFGIYGGGGCCFSFGTHINCEFLVFNCSYQVLDDKSLKSFETTAMKELEKEETNVQRVMSPSRAVSGDCMLLEEFAYDDFLNGKVNLDNILRGRTPVKISGYRNGDLSHIWTPDYLKQKCGEKLVSIHKTRQNRLDFVKKNFDYRCIPFRELVDFIYEGDSEGDLYYLRSVGENIRKEVSNIYSSFPEIAKDFTVLEQLPSFIKENLFSTAFRISSKNIQIWTHYDIMDNILCQVSGSKRVVLWHPNEIVNLYVKDTCSEVLDIDNPDLSKYPDFPKGRGMECVLNPGDMLFIPSLWFHNTTTLDESISVNCFWRHLDSKFYNRKDLYGSKDLVMGEESLEKLSGAMESLKELRPHYKNFYLSKMISVLKRELDKEK